MPYYASNLSVIARTGAPERLVGSGHRSEFRMARRHGWRPCLMRRNADTPMPLAAACLVLTLDNDFRHYRRNGRQDMPLPLPD